jgi:hypothetical protein
MESGNAGVAFGSECEDGAFRIGKLLEYAHHYGVRKSRKRTGGLDGKCERIPCRGGRESSLLGWRWFLRLLEQNLHNGVRDGQRVDL